MTPALRWPLGVIASLALHGAAAAWLVWALAPAPVEDQPQPQTRARVDTYAIDRTSAPEADPDADALAETTPDAPAASQGAIPQSQAAEAAPETASLPASVAAGTPLDAATAPAPSLAALAPDPAPLSPAEAPVTATSAATPQATAAPALIAEVAPLAAAEATPQQAATLAPSAQTARPLTAAPATLAPVTPSPAPALTTEAAPVRLAAATVAPKALTATDAAPMPLPEAAALAAPVPQSAPPLTPTAQVAPAAQSLPEAEAPVTQATASTVIPGAEGLTDPVSLTAFQSFMAPDTLPEGADVKDGLAGLLSGVPCARMRVRFLPETGTLELAGHVPEDGLRAPILAALRQQMGADIAVADNLRVLPRPQCGALTAIEAVGLPQSTDQITNTRIVGPDTHAREFRYAAGDLLLLDMTAPDYPAYLYVDYFDAGGDVIHLSPNDATPLVEVAPKSPLTIGARAPGEPGLYITIGPPYGQEIAVAFAASQPLYDDPRPLSEPAGPYLEFLAGRVAAARAENPDFKGEWVYFFVSTAAE